MNFFKTIFASICIWSGLGSAALAIPVQFTYTGNPLDLSVLEGWERAWVEQNLGYTLHPLRERVEIVLEVDCDITGGVWSCGDDLGGSAGFGVFEPSSGHYQSGDITLVSPGTFVGGIYMNAFTVDATGQVVEWEFVSTEVLGAGNFSSSHTGDFWGWSWYWDYRSDLAYFYCGYTYGYTADQAEWVFSGNYETCVNGEPVPRLDYINRLEIAGTGVWTVDTGEQLIATPLPAGLSLLLGGLGGLAWIRRKQTGRSGA